MAETKITELISIGGDTDRAVDVVEIVDVSNNQSKKATVNQLLNITGAPVGTTDTQTVQNKTLDNTNTIAVADNLFTIQDNSDPTKQAQFQASGITAGQTRIYTLPDVTDSIVTLTASQTLTNKTLTSPTINTATIVNPTLQVDTVAEYTAAAGVTIDGVLLKDSKMNGSYLTDDTVSDTQLDYPRWYQEIGRTTLGVAGDTITVSSLPARKYLRIIIAVTNTGGTVRANIRFNNDSGNNYATRFSSLGGADTTAVSQSAIVVAGASALAQFYEVYVTNIATQEKLPYITLVNSSTVGAGTAPNRVEGAAKWANTTNQITRIDASNDGTGDFAIGSEVVVLGHD